ncbi:hypothetical protein P4O66_007046 [Electrophorus voltai]|uniref:Uncharacterized protein n=1 Tax=Electrophorus voltai TaxID=2609070 RepID=A0AAD8ZGT3_9TELE|nr:hypothetical protein P4O66_007046 [Electrophorus voltai]
MRNIRQNETSLGTVGTQCRSPMHSSTDNRRSGSAHQFHAGCIETWLHQSLCCPLDWQDISNPLTWNDSRGKVKAPANGAQTWVTDEQRSDLFIPGVGLQDRAVRAPALQMAERFDLPREGPLAPLSFETFVQGTRCLCINDTYSGVNSSDPLGLRDKPLGQDPGSATRKRADGKTTLPSSCTLGRTEESGRTHRGSFLGRTEQVSKTQPKTSTLHGQIGPLRHRGWGARPQPRCDSSDLEPWTRSVPFTAKHQRNQK